MIKPIQTRYKGFLFRSRLEARWAVLFDSLGLHWEYEKEGFSVDGEPYLPDFWIEEWQSFVEIKPLFGGVVKDKLYLGLARMYRMLLIQGDPWPGEYKVFVYEQGQKKSIGQFRGNKFKNLQSAYNAARSARFGEKTYA